VRTVVDAMFVSAGPGSVVPKAWEKDCGISSEGGGAWRRVDRRSEEALRCSKKDDLAVESRVSSWVIFDDLELLV